MRGNRQAAALCNCERPRMAPAPMPAATNVRRIRRSRFMAGVAIHFLAPAYILLLIADAAMGRAPGTWAGWLPHALRLGGWFLLIYGLASLALIALAAAGDRRGAQRETHDPAAQSRWELSQSLAGARDRFGEDVAALLDQIAAMPLDHDDSQTRQMVQDLQRLLDAAGAALDKADGAQAPLRRQTAAALATLKQALEARSRESGILAQDKARTLAHYVELKYGEKFD